jgi:hypothetical protein
MWDTHSYPKGGWSSPPFRISARWHNYKREAGRDLRGRMNVIIFVRACTKTPSVLSIPCLSADYVIVFTKRYTSVEKAVDQNAKRSRCWLTSMWPRKDRITMGIPAA